MARLHYNKRIPIIKNLLYLNYSSGRGWSLSFGPPGVKINYGINDHKKQVSFKNVDVLFLILFLSWLSDVDFSHLTILKIIGLIAVCVWLILFLLKLFKKDW
ncbi:DUF4236 domain-containing protein [Sporolactobacillus terrae]|uniref:DUF4236 domain-containing protein n=1 Tax=Sporolactobacillus terrae TaxID=269673 RepID=A0ABX5Q5V4_9BACL|nr:DUF4236 domain-containing protein [Sporolactobacillus terrae]QAA22013.1 hypothetical protein C0674_04945 [Sporolactobacillus terrae]QAA24986.1 hypothetical protein C0679_04920 [Sporolactobacillus terrae]